MTKKTINIFFIILGIIITTISVKKLLFATTFDWSSGYYARSLGIYEENNKGKFRLQFFFLGRYICILARSSVI